jgi:hypothetical protein
VLDLSRLHHLHPRQSRVTKLDRLHGPNCTKGVRCTLCKENESPSDFWAADVVSCSTVQCASSEINVPPRVASPQIGVVDVAQYSSSPHSATGRELTEQTGAEPAVRSSPLQSLGLGLQHSRTPTVRAEETSLMRSLCASMYVDIHFLPGR